MTRETLKTLDPTRGAAKLTFNGAPAERARRRPARGWRCVEQVLDRAAVLLAFEQVGGADRCLEMAKDYALERYAFGRPIGCYQAIKHKLADMYVKNELARSNAYYGAWALNTDAPELPLAAARGAGRGLRGLSGSRPRKTSRPTAASASPGRWTATSTTAARSSSAWWPARPASGRSGWSASSNGATRPRERTRWTSTTPPKKPPTAPRSARGWRPTRPKTP